MCERVVGDAEEAADGSRRECTTEKQEPHTMMGGIAYLETNRIEYVKKCVVTCKHANMPDTNTFLYQPDRTM